MNVLSPRPLRAVARACANSIKPIKFLHDGDATMQSLPDPVRLRPREVLARLQQQGGIDQTPQNLWRIALNLSGQAAERVSELPQIGAGCGSGGGTFGR